MIEDNLMEYIKANNTDSVVYSVNAANLKDNIVTVYSTGGERPSAYEGVLTSPRYQVLIKSSDYDKAKGLAYIIYEQLKNLENIIFNVNLQIDYRTTFTIPVKLFRMFPLNEPIELGANDDDVMEYSLNFEAKLLVLKTEGGNL